LGESIDEERNQESRPEEKGSCQEKEVAAFGPPQRWGEIQVTKKGPARRGLFVF
jgi:hypothetical protein